MARVVLQPAGSAESQRHYEDTVRHAVSLAQCDGLPLADRAILQAAFPGGSAQFWGATPTASRGSRSCRARPGRRWQRIADQAGG
jgi:hypothetical protein